MWLKKVFILFLLSFLIHDQAFAQDIIEKADTTQLYENIESFSNKRKFTQFVHGLLFRPVSKSGTNEVKKKVYRRIVQQPYSAFEGKVIRNINIETLDPFGYSIADTSKSPQKFLLKAGNSLHAKSHKSTIHNLLLIRKNQVYDSLLVIESERLVRSQVYVTDVSFYTVTTSENSDSVDIYIRELDNWSIVPAFAVSSSRVAIGLTDKNFAGMGHESKNAFTWIHTTSQFAFDINYFVPNIRNTYISSKLRYATDEYGNFIRIIGVDRPFYSPFTRWAAGANFTQQLRSAYIRIDDTLFAMQRFRSNIQDYWAGYAIQIFKGNSEYERTTNFISAVRFMHIRYFERPIELYDEDHMFSDEEFYFVSLGISTRKYVHDRYILKFGLPEDVSIGKVYSLTAGYQEKNTTSRLYFGARVSMGNYYPWGYLNFNCEYGTFLGSSSLEQGVLTVDANYFTKLFEIGKWKFRQFVKPQVILGINRFAYDSLTLNEDYGIVGFNSNILSGTSRILLTFQTQTYSPWNFIGFRFGPFFTFSLGMLGQNDAGFKNSKVYSQIGLGVLIKNDHLVINTFQISIAYYPTIPGTGQNLFRINSFRTTDYQFRDFDMGKPGTVLYR